jgi:hypothetical protein
MKKYYIISAATLTFLVGGMLMSFKTATKATYEFTSFTVVESIVPNGMGRSRMISVNDKRNYKDYTKTMTEDDKGRNKGDRGEIRVFGYDETKLLNFYNIGGIRFQNIAANDAIINSKMNAMLADGWEIVTINSGIESDAGKNDGKGIYITRFYFKKTI